MTCVLRGCFVLIVAFVACRCTFHFAFNIAPQLRKAARHPQRSTTRRANYVGRAAGGNATEPLLVVDTEAMLSESTFPIPPDELIKLCHRVIQTGVGTKEPSLLAEDFVFAGPVVGPISREQHLLAVEFAFDKISEAFPDQNGQYYDFRVDPFEPNRVWYTSRATGTMTGKFADFLEPNGNVMRQPPQTNSMSFNERGECIEVTAGYVMDRRVGNTGGLGAVYGVFKAMGLQLPYPEGKPWSPSPPFRLILESLNLATDVSRWLGQMVPAPNTYWRVSPEELNTKSNNKWSVDAKYKPYE